MIDTQYIKDKILDLAVRGKLVDQDPDEGDARDLLKEIQAEKEELIKAKKVKEGRVIDFVEKSYIYDIPNSWEWTKARNIFYIQRGGSPRPIKEYLTTGEGINWIKIGDVNENDKYLTSAKEKITEAGIPKSRLISPGDLILTNSMSYGRPYISQIEGCIHDGWLVLSPYLDIINKEYFYYLFKSPYMQKSFNLAAKGAVVKNLNIDKVKEIFLPIPPLAEQERIVEKIEQSFALLDEIEESQTEITNLAEQFKSKVLDMAISGELVPQNIKDTPAKSLLSNKNTGEREHPLNGWIYTTIEEVTLSVGKRKNQIKKSEINESGDIAVITQGKTFIDGYSNEVDKAIYDFPVVMFGDHTRNVKYIDFPFIIGADGTKFRKSTFGYDKYLYYWMLKTADTLRDRGYQRHYSLINKAPIPLPPLEEQKRIVEKVEQIFKAIDLISE